MDILGKIMGYICRKRDIFAKTIGYIRKNYGICCLKTMGFIGLRI